MNNPLTIPFELQSHLERMGYGAIFKADQSAQLPPQTGAYILLVQIGTAFDLAIATLPSARIDPGFYLYCGSARGPGGIKARVAHHFAQNTKNNRRTHWHIDHLTQAAIQLSALAVIEGDECQLRERLNQSSLFTLPVKGFGASDCKQCDSHLLSWSGKIES